ICMGQCKRIYYVTGSTNTTLQSDLSSSNTALISHVARLVQFKHSFNITRSKTSSNTALISHVASLATCDIKAVFELVLLRVILKLCLNWTSLATCDIKAVFELDKSDCSVVFVDPVTYYILLYCTMQR